MKALVLTIVATLSFSTGALANVEAGNGPFNYNVDKKMIEALSKYECKYSIRTYVNDEAQEIEVQIPLYSKNALTTSAARLAVPENAKDIAVQVFLNNDKSANKDLMTVKVDRYGTNSASYIDWTSLKIDFAPTGFISAAEMLPESSQGENKRGTLTCDLKSTGRAHAKK